MTIKLFVIAICILHPVAFAFRNGYQREEAGNNLRANRKWHLWEFIVKCCFVALVVALTEGWWFKGWGLLMATSLDFLIFPAVLNRRTDQPWDYLSDYGVDKFLKKIPSYVLIVIKAILCFVSVVYYLVNPY